MYCTGGLEPNNTDRNEVLSVDGTNYVLTNKFKTMLRDSFIDWGTFLEVYNDNLTNAVMFDQIVKLLNIKENENLEETMLPLVKKIYKLPAQAHISSLLRQFMVYEPVSIAVQSLFNTIKHHYENIVERFIVIRNTYILQKAIRVKTNTWDKLLNEWNIANADHELESSSVILLFLNPPNNFKSGIHYKIPGKENVIDKLRDAIKKFEYIGFCPLVPYKRLVGLLKFPINEFIQAIKELNPDEKIPDYIKMESVMAGIVSKQSKKPVIMDDIKRKEPPAELINALATLKPKHLISKQEENLKMQLIKWYVNNILDYRKKLAPYGKKYEEYYIQIAKSMVDITELIKKGIK
jgi:hypothetical protein